MITDERYMALVRPAIEAREKVKPIFSGLTIEEKRQFIRLMIEHDELIVTLDVGNDDPFYSPTAASVMGRLDADKVLVWADPTPLGVSDDGKLEPFGQEHVSDV
jgi:hypothetical protein